MSVSWAGLKRLAFGLGALLCLATTAWAQPDFSQSTLTLEPSTVAGGDVVTYTARVRNSGTEAAPFAEVVLTLPLEAMFVDLQGLDAAAVDHDDKRIRVTLDLPAGGERQFRVRMVVPWDAGGNVLSPDLLVRYLYRGVTFNTGEPTDIDTARRPGGLRIGNVRVGAIEAAFLAVIALYPLLWLVLPRRRRSHGSVTMVVISAGFLTMFGGLAWRDAQTLTKWNDASCTILDTRMRIETDPSRIRTGQPPRRGENRNFKPLLAVKYTADGRDVISTGYETQTRLSIGRGESILREYEQWKIGAQAPCWFNPDNVNDVIVIRGFGGAYFFALLPLALLGLGVRSMRK